MHKYQNKILTKWGSIKDYVKHIVVVRGKKYNYITTFSITLDDLRAVFFPKNFYEKYRYLGSVPGHFKEDNIFKAMRPLVILMDKMAKPWWCPRWFLRLLYLFGSDNSLIRVRNKTLHSLLVKLRKGIFIWDYKTKWTDYDLRISVFGPEEIQDLADMIEEHFYSKGRREELIARLSKLNHPDEEKYWIYLPTDRLEHLINELENKNENRT